MTVLNRRHFTRLGLAIPVAGLAARLPGGVLAGEAGSFASDVVDVTLTWESPWEEGVTFGNEGALPILNTTESGAFFVSMASDPLSGFDSWQANLDKIEEDYSTGFFVPFRDGATGIEVLVQERTGTGYAILMAYTEDDGPAFDYYEFRYERGPKAIISCQLSDLAGTFAGTLTSLQEAVTIAGDEPFSILDDDDVLDLAAGLS